MCFLLQETADISPRVSCVSVI